MIVDAREMGRLISEIVEVFDISRSTVLYVYQEYVVEDITVLRRQHNNNSQVLNNHDKRHVTDKRY